MQLRPVDGPRERPAPTGFVGLSLNGDRVEVRFERPTLVVAVKPDCDGCGEFLEPNVQVDGVDLVVTVARDDSRFERDADLVVADALWRALEIRSAPFYVLIDPEQGRVLSEGPLFTRAQVDEEVARALSR